MKRLFGAALRHTVAKVLLALPDNLQRRLLRLRRFGLNFQISAAAMTAVVRRYPSGCNLLVFGVGRDSSTWVFLNRGGRTVFVEDLAEWAARAKGQQPSLEVVEVTYETTLASSLLYSSRTDIPTPTLPASITSRTWDVVVVDGPRGYLPDHPGRSASITLAHDLVAENGMVLIDDWNRPAEQRFTALVFGRPPEALLDSKGRMALFTGRR